MTKYEKIYEVLQEKVDNGEMSVEDAQQINDVAFEKYAYEPFDTDEDIFAEGANLKYRKVLKESEPEIKALFKKARSAYKSENYDDATHYLNDALVIIDKATKEILNIDDKTSDIGEMLSMLTSGSMSFFRMLGQSIILFIPVVGRCKWVAAFNKDHMKIVDEEMPKLLADEYDLKLYNRYRSMIISNLETYKKYINKLINDIEDAKKMKGNSTKSKESSTVESVVSTLKEAVEAGDYTIEEAHEIMADLFDSELTNDAE